MTLGELAQIVAYMARLWPNFSADDETLNVWREWLGDYEFSDVLTVVRTHGADAFPPGPGRIAKDLAHLRGHAPSPSEAFDEALRAWSWNTYEAGRLSHNHPPGFLTPDVDPETNRQRGFTCPCPEEDCPSFGLMEGPGEWQWSHPAVQAASSTIDWSEVYADGKDIASQSRSWERRRFMKTYTEILEREEICAALPAGSRDTLAELERRRDPVLEAGLDVADGWAMPALEEEYD
jgi:hypothetical protein